MEFGDYIWAGHSLTYWVMNYIAGSNGILGKVVHDLLQNPFFCFLFAVLNVLSGFVNSSFLHDWNAITEITVSNKIIFFIFLMFKVYNFVILASLTSL